MEKPTVYLNKRDVTVYGVRRPTTVEIICGDCSARIDESGNAELLPFRTFLAMDGRCHTCGGGSFVIASELCGALRRTIFERRQYGLEEGYTIAAQASESANLWHRPAQNDVLGATVTSRKRSDAECPPALELAHVN